jgi:hypothetical protein
MGNFIGHSSVRIFYLHIRKLQNWISKILYKMMLLELEHCTLALTMFWWCRIASCFENRDPLPVWALPTRVAVASVPSENAPSTEGAHTSKSSHHTHVTAACHKTTTKDWPTRILATFLQTKRRNFVHAGWVYGHHHAIWPYIPSLPLW